MAITSTLLTEGTCYLLFHQIFRVINRLLLTINSNIAIKLSAKKKKGPRLLLFGIFLCFGVNRLCFFKT